MFSTLPASALRRGHDARGMLTSLVFHASVIAAAVWLTNGAGRRAVHATTQALRFYVAPPPATPPVTPRPMPTVALPNAAPSSTQLVVTLPEVVPPTLPAIRMGPSVVDWARVFLRRGGSGGVPEGAGSVAAVSSGDAYDAAMVDQPVRVLPNQPAPRYPETLRDAGVDGHVVARFVVDTLGRVELATMVIVEASHELFAAAVRSALARQRFQPAETGGRRVRQLVVQPFAFVARR